MKIKLIIKEIICCIGCPHSKWEFEFDKELHHLKCHKLNKVVFDTEIDNDCPLPGKEDIIFKNNHF